jgi:hypothetical protein
MARRRSVNDNIDLMEKLIQKEESSKKFNVNDSITLLYIYKDLFGIVLYNKDSIYDLYMRMKPYFKSFIRERKLKELLDAINHN